MTVSRALVLLLVSACSGPTTVPVQSSPAQGAVPAADTSPTTAPKPTGKAEKAAERRTWRYQLEQVDKAIASSTKAAEGVSNSALALEQVATHYLSRARLTGDYADYKHAEELIDAAFTVHDTAFGPWKTRAQLNYTLHRMDRIEADLEQAKILESGKPGARSGQLLFAGKLAFQRGKYAEAKSLYEESLAIEQGSANLSAMAEYEWKTGNFDRGEELYVQADGKYHAPPTEPHAWNHLMRGLMDLDRGRYHEALVHYNEAATWLVGYWLVDEHVAEVLTLTGKTEEAKALYLDIITRTNNPEFMDAMAGILRDEGKSEESNAFVARARERYEALLAMYPEAAYGHALDHYLEFGEDVAFVVDLAEKNHALRPNAEAKILLTHAYLKAERAKDAQRVIEEALGTPWSSADLHEAAAAVYTTLGDTANADAQIAKAKAINPRIMGG